MARRRKNAPIEYNGCIIRPTPYETFQAEINRPGQRTRKHFDTLEQAKAWIDAQIIMLSSNEAPLSLIELREARQAINLLPQGISLVSVVREWLDDHKTQSITLQDAVDKFLGDKDASGDRAAGLASLRSRVRALLGPLAAVTADQVTSRNLIEWLDDNHVKGETRNNFRKDWRNLFNWCISQGYCRTNPADGIMRVRLDQKLPGVLTVRQAWRVLHAAERDYPPLVPYLAVGLFAGVRPGELMRLKWDAITNEHIHIGPGVAKVRQQRFVSLTPNLRAWLKAYRGSGRLTPMAHKTQYDHLTRLREAAGIDEWPDDAMRHSFATYFLAMTQDAGRTAHELGHTTPDTLYAHYRNLATQKEGRRFFEIMPRKCP